MRILFFGDLDATGFGTVTQDLGRRMLDLGDDVRFLSQNEIGDLPEPFRSRTADARTLIPTQNPVTGMLDSIEPTSVIGGLIRGHTPAKLVSGEPWGGWTPEAVILLGDFRAAQMIYVREPEAFEQVPSYHYCPVEGIDLPPAWGTMWSVIKPIAMSEFGQAEIAKVMGYQPPMIYHGVDAQAFHPVSRQNPIILQADGRPDARLTSKAECKNVWAAWFGGPVGKKWILRTDRHMPRKRYNSMLRGLAPVLYRNPDVTLVIHCMAYDLGGGLPDTLSKIPGSAMLNETSEKKPQQRWGLFGRQHAQVLITDARGFPRAGLVSLYNAADLYVSVSAEGFGLTVAESIACGVPAVALEFSAVPEVVGPAGVCVRRAYLVENEYDHFWAAIDEEELAKRTEFLITHQTRREDLGKKGPAHIAANFDWDVSARQFRDLLHADVVTRHAA